MVDCEKIYLQAYNIKYNYTVLFLRQTYWVFIYASIYFLIDRHSKPSQNFVIFWTSSMVDLYRSANIQPMGFMVILSFSSSSKA